ncbi:MAG: SpoVG family protein [Bacteroidales bacterium]|nr:SpoVG family protein [Bacteroidales bacterium]
MVITEVRIKLCEENNERLLAFCSITFDNAFVIRDLKLIEGTRGMFVAMPSRKLTDRCCKCGSKNHLRSRFCNQCGFRLDENRANRDPEGRAKLHADIAHPIHSGARELIQQAVMRSFQDEKVKSKMPGYVCRYDDYDSDFEEADAAISYGTVAIEMGKTIKAHTAHGAAPAPRGPHFHAATESRSVPVRATHADEGFGAGII